MDAEIANHTSKAGDAGSIPGWENKIPHAMPKKKKSQSSLVHSPSARSGPTGEAM